MSVEAPERSRLEEFFPTEDEYQRLLGKRTRRGRLVQMVFMMALITAVLALAALLYTIINDSFGLRVGEPGGRGESGAAQLLRETMTTAMSRLRVATARMAERKRVLAIGNWVLVMVKPRDP